MIELRKLHVAYGQREVVERGEGNSLLRILLEGCELSFLEEGEGEPVSSLLASGKLCYIALRGG